MHLILDNLLLINTSKKKLLQIIKLQFSNSATRRFGFGKLGNAELLKKK